MDIARVVEGERSPSLSFMYLYFKLEGKASGLVTKDKRAKDCERNCGSGVIRWRSSQRLKRW